MSPHPANKERRGVDGGWGGDTPVVYSAGGTAPPAQTHTHSRTRTQYRGARSLRPSIPCGRHIKGSLHVLVTIWVPDAPYFIFFFFKAQAVGFLQGGFHSNSSITGTHTTTINLNIQPIYSVLFFSPLLLPGPAGSLLHFRKWLRTPFSCSENRGTTNHT